MNQITREEEIRLKKICSEARIQIKEIYPALKEAKEKLKAIQEVHTKLCLTFANADRKLAMSKVKVIKNTNKKIKIETEITQDSIDSLSPEEADRLIEMLRDKLEG